MRRWQGPSKPRYRFAIKPYRSWSMTGHLANGFLVDDHPVGVFAAWNLSVVQLYAVATDAYMSLSAEFLELEDRRERLCRQIFGNLSLEYVYSRPKVCAKVGDPGVGGGVFVTCVTRGFDSLWLRGGEAR